MKDPLSRKREYFRVVAYVTKEIETEIKLIAIERDCFINDIANEAVNDWLEKYRKSKAIS